MFNTPVEIHRRYDLKGSWVGKPQNHLNLNQSWILRSLDFGWDELHSFMWRLVTSLKRAGDSKLVRTCDDCLSCLQVGRVTATEKRDPHVALKAHFSLPNSLSVNLPFGFPDARVNVSGCWFWEGQWKDQAWRGRDARVRFVSWISESRFWSPLDPSLVQERRVRMLAQIRRDSLYLRKLSWRLLLERSNNSKNKSKKSKTSRRISVE